MESARSQCQRRSAVAFSRSVVLIAAIYMNYYRWYVCTYLCLCGQVWLSVRAPLGVCVCLWVILIPLTLRSRRRFFEKRRQQSRRTPGQASTAGIRAARLFASWPSNQASTTSGSERVKTTTSISCRLSWTLPVVVVRVVVVRGRDRRKARKAQLLVLVVCCLLLS